MTRVSKTVFKATSRLGAALLATGLFASLVGCSSNDEPEQTSAPAASEESTETGAPAEETPAGDVSGELTVYAAASLEPAFEQLMQDFSKEHPGVTFAPASYDGSSVLATQIIGGAPVDVFASADEPNMTKVTDESLNEGEPIGFATSTLAIAVAPDNPLGIETMADLVGIDTVICAPEVPCGNASHTLLDRDGVDLAPASEVQNVTAVLTKVREGEADAGLVYYSDILRAGDEVEGIEIPNAGDAAGDYMITPVVGTKSPEAAVEFSEYLLSDHAQQYLAELGFGPARKR